MAAAAESRRCRAPGRSPTDHGPPGAARRCGRRAWGAGCADRGPAPSTCCPRTSPRSLWRRSPRGRAGWWDLDADAVLLDEDAARGVPAPYPGLVTIGSTERGPGAAQSRRASALLLDGNPVHITEVCTSLALELGMSPWAGDVEVVTVGFGEDLPQLLPTARIAHMRPARARAARPDRTAPGSPPTARHSPPALPAAVRVGPGCRHRLGVRRRHRQGRRHRSPWSPLPAWPPHTFPTRRSSTPPSAPRSPSSPPAKRSPSSAWHTPPTSRSPPLKVAAQPAHAGRRRVEGRPGRTHQREPDRAGGAAGHARARYGSSRRGGAGSRGR